MRGNVAHPVSACVGCFLFRKVLYYRTQVSNRRHDGRLRTDARKMVYIAQEKRSAILPLKHYMNSLSSSIQKECQVLTNSMKTLGVVVKLHKSLTFTGAGALTPHFYRTRTQDFACNYKNHWFV